MATTALRSRRALQRRATLPTFRRLNDVTVDMPIFRSALRRGAVWPRRLRLVVRSAENAAWRSCHRDRRDGRVAICAIFRDEAPYLGEWVAFHRLMGVTEFYLYNHGSSDAWRRELEPHMSEGVVTVREWTVPRPYSQRAAYLHCVKTVRDRVRWLACIDIDEFLFSPAGRSLPEVLAEFMVLPGLVARWRVYGTSGFSSAPEGLVIENFVWRGADEHFRSSYFKAVVDPRRTLLRMDSSAHEFLHPVAWRPWRAEGTRVHEASVEILRINHYYSKSRAEATAKWLRGGTEQYGADSVPLDALLDPELNVVRDDSLVRFGPAVRRAMPMSMETTAVASLAPEKR